MGTCRGERPCWYLDLLASGTLGPRLWSEPPKLTGGVSLHSCSVHRGDDRGLSRLMGGAQQTLTPAGEGPRGAYRRGIAFVGTWLVRGSSPASPREGCAPGVGCSGRWCQEKVSGPDAAGRDA